MEKQSHVAGWYSDSPTPAQLKELFAQIESGRIKKGRLQVFLIGDIEVIPKPKWLEENGVIYSSVTSDGTTGEEWNERLESKGFRISDYAESILLSDDFKPTNGITTEIAVLKGELFCDDERITKNIHSEASNRKLTKPNAEVACLIREKFTDEDLKKMGLCWLAVMHEPIKNSDGVPYLLYAYQYDGGRWLRAYCNSPDSRWDSGSGFAFAVSQVSA